MGAAIKEIWQESAVLGEFVLIFVTIGWMRAFERLVKEMDRLASKLDEKVIMQIGSTDYEPKNCDYFRFAPRSKIEDLCIESRMVICHAGVGSILTAIKYNKPLILVPREKKYREVFDDHQLEIAGQMKNRGVAVVYNMNNLESAIENVSTSPIEFEGEKNLVNRLKEYLDQLDNELK